jgi:hypothetical protein
MFAHLRGFILQVIVPERDQPVYMRRIGVVTEELK